MIQAIRNLIDLFSPAQKRTALVLILLMVGGMILETLGIGMVVPAIMLLTRDDLGTRFPGIAQAIASTGITDRNELVVAGMLSLAAVYTLKCFYIAWITSLQMRFVYGIQADISRRLFIGYLYKPYTFHLQRNSSELLRSVVTATDELTMTGLVGVLILTTEALVLFGISLLLLYVEPVGTIVAAGFLAVFGFALNRATRRGIRRAGEAKKVHEEKRIRYLQQALGGAKELKLLGRERGAVLQYTPHNEASARIGQYQATLQALPKLWLELLAVLGLVALVLTLIWQGKPIDNLIPTIGMFAAAAFRLIPSMNRILGSLQYIRYSIPTINTLHAELVDSPVMPEAEAATTLSLSQAISADDISVRYPEAETRVIEGATFSIARGTTVGFIGGSGVGKSTLVDALLGLLPLEHGRILADGVDIHDDLRAWQNQIGYVPQSIYLTDDSIRRNIAFGLPDEDIDEASVQRAVAAAQLDVFIAQLPAGLDTVAGERGVRLSGGQRQRIGIARALYHNPAVLVLDEATSSLDTDTENSVMQAISALHGAKTILIVTHRPNTLKYCDRVIRIERASVHEVADHLIH
jgi:ABC-type multidrug transport system fused ATPase/permease subunit